MRKTALLSVLMVAISTPVLAQPANNYAILKAGVYLPQASDLDEFDNAFYGELGFGHYLSNNIALELSAGYTETSASVSDPTGSIDADLTIIPITLGLKFLIPAAGFEPFVTAGVGLYFVDLDADVTLFGFGSGSGSENDTAFGGYLGAGANFNVTQTTFVGFEGKYFFATPSFAGIDVDINGINLTANLGFRF